MKTSIAALALICLVLPAEVRAEADEKRVAALEQKLANLEASYAKRIAELEKQVAALKSSAVTTDAGQEKAREALGKIHSLRAEGKVPEAKKQLDAWLAEYGSSKFAAGARQVKTELEIVDKAVPKTWDIKEWIQGKDAVNMSRKEPVVLVFWEFWCPHCRREIPEFQAESEATKKKGVEVVTFTKMSRGVSKDVLEKFLTENKISLPVAVESGQISEYFGVSSVPAAAVIENGKIVWRGHPSQLPPKYTGK